jgi:hypothetical protein
MRTFLALGQQLMNEAQPRLGEKWTMADAAQFRDGLMIAPTASAPMCRRNITTLDSARHLSFTEDAGTIVVPKKETKTAGLNFIGGRKPRATFCIVHFVAKISCHTEVQLRTQ